MYGVINQEAIIMCNQRRRLMNSTLRCRESHELVVAKVSSLRRIRVIIDHQDAPFLLVNRLVSTALMPTARIETESM